MHNIDADIDTETNEHRTSISIRRMLDVHLTVSDLERSVAFYKHNLGFHVQRTNGSTAYLGAGSQDLLILVEQPGAVLVPRRSGLYHFAILVPSRLELARCLQRMINTGVQLGGFADHLVSEAIYLADPDGNGIEIYRDRPRSEWQYTNGQLHMATLPLDYQGLLAELDDHQDTGDGLHKDTVLGHMHLHVADLAGSESFFIDVLGFDKVARMSSASFVSAGGYHHHIAFNTWNGVGVLPNPHDAVGLRHFSVQLRDKDELGRLSGRLSKANIAFNSGEKSLVVNDPSQNTIHFVT